MQPRALDVDVGIRLTVWDHGGDGAVALVLHGYLDTARSHDEVALALKGNARVLAVDLRGHGASSKVGAGGSYHLLDHMKDVAELIERLPALVGAGLDVLVGHSMGGNVALLVAGSAPELVPRLVLVDTLGPPSEPAALQPERLGSVLRAHGEVKPFKRVSSREEAIARVRATNPGLSALGAERMVAHALIEESPGVFAFALDDRLRGPAPVRYEESFYEALCARVTGPVHLVRAEQGYVAVDDEPWSTRARLLDAVVTTAAGVGHNVHVEAPEAVAGAVREVLSHRARVRRGAT